MIRIDSSRIILQAISIYAHVVIGNLAESARQIGVTNGKDIARCRASVTE